MLIHYLGASIQTLTTSEGKYVVTNSQGRLFLYFLETRSDILICSHSLPRGRGEGWKYIYICLCLVDPFNKHLALLGWWLNQEVSSVILQPAYAQGFFCNYETVENHCLLAIIIGNNTSKLLRFDFYLLFLFVSVLFFVTGFWNFTFLRIQVWNLKNRQIYSAFVGIPQVRSFGLFISQNFQW